ncbi:MAG TPA: glycosyltransferase family 4 protein [Lacunisphaera sp.]|nr:glycosyltransferase family 4 protein [Lacunisphaera sp.]
MRLIVHDYAGHPFPIDLSRQLAINGHTVTHAYASQLLTPRGILQAQKTDSVRLGFAAVPMSPDYRNNKYSFLKRVRYEREYGHKLVRLMIEMKPDLILSGQTPSEPQLNLITAANKLRIPVVSWVQDFYSMAVDKLARKKLPLVGAMAGVWYRYLDRQCFTKSAHIVAITEDFLPMLASFGVPKEKVSVIPNWAPLDALSLRPRDNPWSRRHGLNHKFVFLYSGTLAMKHNPDLLRRLAVHFRHEANVRVVVISEGPGADYLKRCKKAEELANLILKPFQAFEEMPEVLASADVLVTILESEAGIFSVPSKVHTYHAAGRAILGAMPEENLASRIIKHQHSGLSVTPDDVDAFISSAERLRLDPVLVRQMGQQGRAYAEREFRIDRISARFETVFRKAMGDDAANQLVHPLSGPKLQQPEGAQFGDKEG